MAVSRASSRNNDDVLVSNLPPISSERLWLTRARLFGLVAVLTFGFLELAEADVNAYFTLLTGCLLGAAAVYAATKLHFIR